MQLVLMFAFMSFVALAVVLVMIHDVGIVDATVKTTV